MPSAGFGLVYLADGTTLVSAGQSYSLTDIQGMQFTPTTELTNNAVTTVVIDVTDDGGTTNGGNDTLTHNVQITITPVNDAPVLDSSGFLSLAAIDEDATNPAGETIAQILASDGGGAITDADIGSVEGVAVTSVDDTNGTWQYSTNGGTNWLNFGAVSDTQATLLDPTALIRFVPATDYNGVSTFVFKAWDQTTGTTGDTAVDVTTDGGSTAFSATVEAVVQQINPVNDAPLALASGAILPEDTTATVLIGGLDVDGTVESVRLVSLPANGIVYADAGLTTPLVTGVDYPTTAGGITVYYQPNLNFVGNDSFQYVVTDDLGLDSAISATGTLTFTQVNDAPTIDLDADDSQGPNGIDFNTAFAAGNGPIALTDGVSVEDVDNTIQRLTITITNIADGAAEVLSFASNPQIGASYLSATGVLTFVNNGGATNADFAAILDSPDLREHKPLAQHCNASHHVRRE